MERMETLLKAQRDVRPVVDLLDVVRAEPWRIDASVAECDCSISSSAEQPLQKIALERQLRVLETNPARGNAQQPVRCAEHGVGKVPDYSRRVPDRSEPARTGGLAPTIGHPTDAITLIECAGIPAELSLLRQTTSPIGALGDRSSRSFYGARCRGLEDPADVVPSNPKDARFPFDRGQFSEFLQLRVRQWIASLGHGQAANNQCIGFYP